MKTINMKKTFSGDLSTSLQEYIHANREESEHEFEQKKKQRFPDGGKYDRFIDVRTGKEVVDHKGERFASRSPQFNRKKYPYLSDREFQNRKLGK